MGAKERNARWRAKLSPERKKAIIARSSELRRLRIAQMTPDARERRRLSINAALRQKAASNRPAQRAKNKLNYARHREARKQYQRNYFAKNKERILARNKKYTARNIAKARKRRVRYYTERIKKDPAFKIYVRLKFSLSRHIKKRDLMAVKTSRMSEIIGMSRADFATHISNQWLPGMTWENYGLASTTVKRWHIDHIKPCSTFNLLNPDEQKACFHFSNLRPLWALDNITKSNKWPFIN